MKFELTTQYEGPLAAVVEVLCSKAIYRARLEATGHDADFDYTAAGLKHAVTLAVGAADLPPAARGLLKNGVKVQLRCEPELRYEGGSSGELEGAALPYTLAVTGAPVSGSFHVALAKSASRTSAKISGEVRVKIPFVGARVEKEIATHVGELLKKDVALVNAQIGKHL